jgi:hypothetical protein
MFVVDIVDHVVDGDSNDDGDAGDDDDHASL